MSLHGDYDPENIFAKIIRGEIPCAKVFEDDHVIAFMDAFPQAPGHTLVVPKAQARNLLELSETDAAEAIIRAKRIAAAVETALEPDGIIFTQFSGAPAGQTVFHVHFHIIPRSEGAAMAGHGQGMADMADLETMAARIREAL